MANPQKENGFVSIATELFQEMCKVPLSGSEFRVLLFTIRKTYGFAKKQDWISLSQYALGTGLSRRHVIRTLNRLVVNRTLLKSENGHKYGINKDYSQWGSGQLTTGGSDQTGQKVVVNQPPTIDILQKINTAANAAKPMKKNRMGAYREDAPQDSFEESIDIETGESTKPKEKPGVLPVYKELIEWSEKRRRFKFLSIPKQYKVFKEAKTFGILPHQLKARWLELEEDKFYAEKGFDWGTVVYSFNRKQK